MTDPETRLAALWAEDEPPAHDPVFVGQIATRIEQRRWLQTVLELLVLAVVALVVGWAAWPFVAGELARAAPWLAVAGAVGLAVWSVDRTLSGRVFGGYEDFTREFASD